MINFQKQQVISSKWATAACTCLAGLMGCWLPLTLNAQALMQQQSLEDLHLQLSVDRLTLAVDEQLKYTLSVEVPPTIIVQFQAIEDTLGTLPIVQRHPRGPTRIDEQMQRWQREYVLQPHEQGSFTIPSLTTVFFQDNREVSRTPCISADKCPRFLEGRRRIIEIDLADSRRELSTEPVTITVVEAATKLDSGPIKRLHTQHKNLDEFQLSFTVDQQIITNAEHFLITTLVETPLNIAVDFQAIDTHLGALKVLKRRPRGPISTEQQTHFWQRQYLLQPEQIGELTIPSLVTAFFTTDKSIERTPCVMASDCPTLSAHDPGPEILFADTRQELTTDPVAVTVTQLVSKEAQNTDKQATNADQNALPKWIIVGVLGLIVVALVILRRNRQRAKQSSITKQNLSASTTQQNNHSVALQALTELARENLIDQQRIEEFYQRLSQIIRHYLADHFQLATANTTEEILVGAQTGLIASQREQLSDLLGYCDHVKFARYQPSPHDCEKMFQQAQIFIEKTAQKA